MVKGCVNNYQRNMVSQTATSRKFNIFSKNKHLALHKSFVLRQKNRAFIFSKTFLMRFIAMLEEAPMPNPAMTILSSSNYNFRSRYVLATVGSFS